MKWLKNLNFFKNPARRVLTLDDLDARYWFTVEALVLIAKSKENPNDCGKIAREVYKQLQFDSRLSPHKIQAAIQQLASAWRVVNDIGLKK